MSVWLSNDYRIRYYVEATPFHNLVAGSGAKHVSRFADALPEGVVSDFVECLEKTLVRIDPSKKLHLAPRVDLHFAEVPCYDDPYPITHYKGLFWPHPLYVEVLFLPEALDRGVTENQIKWVMEHELEDLYAIRENKPNSDLDGIYKTVATYASALVPKSGGGIEIALRQNLSDEWKEKCRQLQQWRSQCLVFHALWLPRSSLRKRKEPSGKR